jgi:hypothetical protein
VLLQAGAERGLALARATSEDVVRTALWCLADGKAELAVEALETGRGLVLHAATAAADVPALLRAAGHGGLAAEWEAAGASTTEPPWDSTTWSSEPGNESDQRRIVDFLTGSTPAIPHDLRFRVLAALDDSAATGRLLTPPTVQEIAATLQAAGQDAIVYLLPRLERAPGRALLISAGAEVIELPLYLLHTEPEGRVAAYVAAQREALASGKTDEERAAAAAWWRNALGELCDWAWDAAVSPLLGHPAVRRLDHPPRLTLVPVGLLGAVPWHAARTRDAGGDQLHYACEAAVFSYAASARQLDDAVHRRRHPLNAAPVIVANPTGDLPFATIEARALVERHYPDGVYLGQPRKLAAGTGTPEEVLAWLPTPERPGASVLHLGCHAHTGLSSASAHLELADRQPLAVTRILRQAHGRPADSAGGLIVIAACTSDLTNRDHDEALTLATTFLAAGAVSVVGARWEVGDARTALLMVMFHHYLNGTHPTPVDALHAAQRWMLDPGREIPAGISPLLADWATKADLRDAFAWAAFTHHGQ